MSFTLSTKTDGLLEDLPLGPTYKDMPGTFLKERYFDPEEAVYTVHVDEKGVTVYSECCGATMTRDTARALRNAINEYLEATA